MSIDAPEGSKAQTLASFERLDVNVALMPLFQKQVEVSSLALIKPVIALEMLESGKLNAITKELEELSSGGEEGAASASAQPPISLDKIRIKDATFSYLDHKSKSETKVQNINLDLSAASLNGPFDAQGSLFYSGYALNFDVAADAYDAENKMISPKIKLILAPGDLALQYEGVISFGEGVSLQGQTGLYSANLAKALKEYGVSGGALQEGELKAKGLLTADTKSLDYKNVSLTLNGQQMEGGISVTFAPLVYTVNLKTPDAIALGSILQNSNGFKQAVVDFSIKGDTKKTSFDKSSMTLDGQKVSFSGGYNASGKRSKIELNASSPKIDYDRAMANMPKSGGGGDLKSSISALQMPFDLYMGLDIGEVIWQKKTIKGLALKAKVEENTIDLSRLSLKDLGGSSVKISGDIQNVQKVSGITAYVDIDSPDVHKLGKWLDVDTSGWPANLKKANIKTKATGSFEKMGMTTNVSAMGGEVIAKGDVASPLSNFALSNLALQIKHKNMAQAIQIATSAVIEDKNLQKPLDFYTKVNQNGQRYTLSEIKGNLSGISVTGDLDINLGSSVPEVKGALDFGKVELESVMTSSAPKPGSARWSKEPINTSSLHAVNADIKLAAQSITYGAWPLNKPKMHLKLKGGVLGITELTSGVFGGNMALTTKVKSSKEARSPIHFENASEFKAVDMGKLSKALVGTQLVKLSGTGNLDLNLKSSGASPAALIYDLNGQGVVKGTDIILDGVDVKRFARALSDDSKPGDTILGIWKGSTKGGQTSFETLDGAFVIKDGVAQISKMDLDGPEAKIETVGTVDLPKWYLSTQHKMIVKGTEDVPSDIPPFEMSFKGPLDNPAQTFGQGLLNDYLNRKIQRKFNKLLSDKLGLPSNDNKAPANEPAAGEEQPQQNQAAPQQQKAPDLEDAAKDAIEDVLKDLFR